MRPMSRAVLAREEASKVAAAEMPNGPCAGRGALWGVLEMAHRRARTPDEAESVIRAVRQEFCGRCPALMRCGRLAETQQYTGLAAAAAYEEGERQAPDWVPPRAGAQRKKKAS